MTRPDPFIDQLEGYLDEYEGFTPLPDAVRDAVRAELPHTKQVGSLRWPMKYLNLTMAMPAPVRYGLVAGVLVVAAAVGSAFFRSAGNVGAPPTPTPIPPSSAVLIEPGSAERPLEAGTYYVDAPFPMRISFDLPQDWVTWGYTSKASQINLNDAVGRTPGEVSFEIIDNITADPCTSRLLHPRVGPSVDDLVTALSNMQGFEATPPTDVTIDGFHGKQFTLTAPDSDPRCGSLLTWKTTTRQNGVGAGEVNDVRILDVDGVRLLIGIAYTPPLSEGALSELEGIVDSVQITP
jgi:hypothetical protein